MKMLVIGDASGKAHLSVSGYEKLPKDLFGIIVDVPEGQFVSDIDVTDIQRPIAVLKDLPISEK